MHLVFKYFLHIYELCLLRFENIWTWIFYFCSVHLLFRIRHSYRNVHICVLNVFYHLFALQNIFLSKYLHSYILDLTSHLILQISLVNFISFLSYAENGNLGSQLCSRLYVNL